MKTILIITILLISLTARSELNTSIPSIREFNLKAPEYTKVNLFLPKLSTSYPMTYKQTRANQWRKLALFTTHIVLNAAGDALYDRGKAEHNKDYQYIGHTLKALSVLDLLSMPYFCKFERGSYFYHIAAYTCLRIAMFDVTYNAFRGVELGYIGNQSYWDKFMQEINPPDYMNYFGRAVFLGFGVVITFDQL